MHNSEQTIPDRELCQWQSNPYERLRTLYPVAETPVYLRTVAMKESFALYKSVDIVGALTEFAQPYSYAVAMKLEFEGNVIDPAIPNLLASAFLGGVLVAMDANAYVLTDVDRHRLYNAGFVMSVCDEVTIDSPEVLNRVLIASAMGIIEDIENRKHDLVPFEIRLVGEAMFRDFDPSVALEQERAFGIGASLVYEAMFDMSDPNTGLSEAS